jgi:hypothetical protein
MATRSMMFATVQSYIKRTLKISPLNYASIIAGKGSRKIWTEDMSFLDSFYKQNPMRKMFFLKSVESDEDPEDFIDKYIKQVIDFRQCAYDVLSPLGLYVNGTMNPFNCQSKF